MAKMQNATRGLMGIQIGKTSKVAMYIREWGLLAAGPLVCFGHKSKEPLKVAL